MAKPAKKFSIWKFSVLVVIQFAILLLGIKQFFPTLWTEQWSAGPGSIVVTFLVMHLFNCFFEWGFHRYVLHSAALPLLRHFATSHRHHHALTNIQLQRAEAGPGRIVLNRYPITEPEQYESSAFPGYALAVFWVLFTPLLIMIHQIFPHAPIFLGGYAALTWSMVCYEILHSIEHYPFEWWESAVNKLRDPDRPELGKTFQAKFWTLVYGFHHFHHANIKANEAISGFFGLPIGDWVFRTYHQPEDLLLQGRMATAKEFEVGKPWPFVRWLDNRVQAWESKALRRRSKPPAAHL